MVSRFAGDQWSRKRRGDGSGRFGEVPFPLSLFRGWGVFSRRREGFLTPKISGPGVSGTDRTDSDGSDESDSQNPRAGGSGKEVPK